MPAFIQNLLFFADRSQAIRVELFRMMMTANAAARGPANGKPGGLFVQAALHAQSSLTCKWPRILLPRDPPVGRCTLSTRIASHAERLPIFFAAGSHVLTICTIISPLQTDMQELPPWDLPDYHHALSTGKS